MRRITFQAALQKMHEREAEEFGFSPPAAERSSSTNGGKLRKPPKRNFCPCGDKAVVMRRAPRLHQVREEREEWLRSV
jgi:hypothetical protein